MPGPNADDNPFAPGFGAVPRVLSGREPVFADLEKLVRRTRQRRFEEARLLTGDRGFGKTAILAELAAARGEAGTWIVDIEASRRGSLVAAIVRRVAQELQRSLDHRVGEAMQRALAVVSSVALRHDIGGIALSAPARPVAASGDVATDLGELLREVCEAAAARGTSVLLTVDEVQSAEDELAPFGTALQTLVRRAANPLASPPLAIVLGGLPNARAVLRRHGGTYGERVHEHVLGALSSADAAEALQVPAEQEGSSFTEEALTLLVEESEGYPYAIQMLGYQTWSGATSDPMDKPDARRGAARTRAQLRLLYASRLDDVPEREQAYLRAAAQVPLAERTPAAIADVLEGTAGRWSWARSRLVGRGLLRESEGLLHFTLPGFDRYLGERVGR